MSLFERINQRTVLVQRNAATDIPPTDLLSLTFAEVRQAVRSSVRVVADDCAAWCADDVERWRSTETRDPFDSMGPLRLPFDSMWIEWRFPRSPKTDGTQFASWVTAEKPPHGAPSASAQRLELVLFMANASMAVYSPVSMGLEVGELGEPLRIGCSADAGSKTAVDTRSRLIPALVAIGLMNCRNVQVIESEMPSRSRSSRKRKKGERKKPNPLANHVITLPGGPRYRSLAEARDASGAATSLHKVRGHFKTFTADAPLLGKHVGTYWWRPSVRGDLEAGRIDSSYRIKPT